MPRQVFQLCDSNQSPTKYVGLCDDGQNMRVHVGHFFNAGGRDMATYESPTPLWKGRCADWSDEVIAQIVGGNVQEPVKKVVRRRRA